MSEGRELNMSKELELKLLNNQELTEDELIEFSMRGDETDYGSKHRWTTDATTYHTVTDDSGNKRIFALDWYEGNVEMMENEYYEQPYEVEMFTKQIEVKEYRRKTQP